jgi:hypothetical protein
MRHGSRWTLELMSIRDGNKRGWGRGTVLAGTPEDECILGPCRSVSEYMLVTETEVAEADPERLRPGIPELCVCH